MSILFPDRVYPFSAGDKTNFDIAASPEGVSVYLKNIGADNRNILKKTFSTFATQPILWVLIGISSSRSVLEQKF